MIETRHDIKLYQLDPNFYGYDHLRDLDSKILYIVDQHREKYQNHSQIGTPLQEIEIGDVKYQIYVFNVIERESSWKEYLPSQIINEDDFTVRTTSFVLFAIIEQRLYAILGGQGIFVIKRYLNQTFGLDLFEKIADPPNDVVVTIESRGIAGNLSSQSATYRNEQKLIDSLSFGRIPHRLTIQLRDTLIADVFDFVSSDQNEKIYADLGSSFYIKSKMNFHETHLLIKRANEILNLPGLTPLSNFVQVKDTRLVSDTLRLQLYADLRDDMMRSIPPNSNPYGIRFDIDFVHPSNLTDFYECDCYKLYARNARIPFFETTDRTCIYKAGLKYAYENVAHSNQYDFNMLISGVRVKGYKNGELFTHAMFTQHITCEISYQNNPVFQIDSRWYQVKGNFISNINDLCHSMIQSNYLSNTIPILPWDSSVRDEGDYNLTYTGKDNFLVFDKMLGNNIELCDLLFEDETTLYLIHVKKGFDAKIRDLSNQISISANRLWPDIKSGSFEFLSQVVGRYNDSVEQGNELDLEAIKLKFKKDIVYVLAFNSQLANNRNVRENISSIRSNIGKFSLIQCVRDMQANNYPIKIVEICNS